MYWENVYEDQDIIKSNSTNFSTFYFINKFGGHLKILLEYTILKLYMEPAILFDIEYFQLNVFGNFFCTRNVGE